MMDVNYVNNLMKKYSMLTNFCVGTIRCYRLKVNFLLEWGKSICISFVEWKN